MEILLIVLLAGAAVAAALAPFIAQARSAAPPAPASLEDDAAIEAEVGRYREALRAGTVCARCVFANPPGSRFCADCGRPLFDPAPAGAGAGGGA